MLWTAAGIYRVACIEGDRPYLMCIVPKGRPLEYKFEVAAATEVFRFRSTDGQHDLVLGVRADLADWKMPAASKGDWDRNQQWLKETFGI